MLEWSLKIQLSWKQRWIQQKQWTATEISGRFASVFVYFGQPSQVFITSFKH